MVKDEENVNETIQPDDILEVEDRKVNYVLCLTLTPIKEMSIFLVHVTHLY